MVAVGRNCMHRVCATLHEEYSHEPSFTVAWIEVTVPYSTSINDATSEVARCVVGDRRFGIVVTCRRNDASGDICLSTNILGAKPRGLRRG